MEFNPQPKKGKKKKKSNAIPKAIVKAVFERDNYTCYECDRQEPVEQHSLQVHHVILKSQGGKDTMDNLITLCWQCHRLEHD